MSTNKLTYELDRLLGTPTAGQEFPHLDLHDFDGTVISNSDGAGEAWIDLHKVYKGELDWDGVWNAHAGAVSDRLFKDSVRISRLYSSLGLEDPEARVSPSGAGAIASTPWLAGQIPSTTTYTYVEPNVSDKVSNISDGMSFGTAVAQNWSILGTRSFTGDPTDGFTWKDQQSRDGRYITYGTTVSHNLDELDQELFGFRTAYTTSLGSRTYTQGASYPLDGLDGSSVSDSLEALNVAAAANNVNAQLTALELKLDNMWWLDGTTVKGTATNSLQMFNRIYAQSGANKGYSFDANPGGGTGDVAGMDYIVKSGQNTRLHLFNHSDPDDDILLDGGSIDLWAGGQSALSINTFRNAEFSSALTVQGTTTHVGHVANTSTMTTVGAVVNQDTVQNTGGVTNLSTVTTFGHVSNLSSQTTAGAVTNQSTTRNDGAVTNNSTMTTVGTVTNQGATVNQGGVLNQSTVTTTGLTTNNGAVVNSSTVTNKGAVTNESTVVNEGAVTNESTVEFQAGMDITAGSVDYSAGTTINKTNVTEVTNGGTTAVSNNTTQVTGGTTTLTNVTEVKTGGSTSQDGVTATVKGGATTYVNDNLGNPPAVNGPIKFSEIIMDGPIKDTNGDVVVADPNAPAPATISTDSRYLRKDQSDTSTGTITATGFNVSSDRRFKSNITQMREGLKEINSLTPCTYKYISTIGGGNRLGFIAQDLQAILPGVVHEDTSHDKYLSIDNNQILAVLVKAVQELSAQVQELKSPF